jgi:flagellar hook-basal body complex protein FliE
VNIGGIDSSRIEAMMAQLKAAASKPAGGTSAADATNLLGGVGQASATASPESSSKVSFSDALKNSLQNVSDAQNGADQMGQRFAAGDNSVSLSDTMIAMQKASISFQATLQVRNKLVSAYHDIMNMQV